MRLKTLFKSFHLERIKISPSNRDWGKGTSGVTPGRQWFWVLLPKQKSLS